MTESQLDACIQRACETLNLRHYHVKDSRRDVGDGEFAGLRRGLPDWRIVGPGGVIVRECKVHFGRGPTRGQLSGDQEDWLSAEETHGVDTGLWTDRDWRDGIILAELKALQFRRHCEITPFANVYGYLRDPNLARERRRIEIQCDVMPHD